MDRDLLPSSTGASDSYEARFKVATRALVVAGIHESLSYMLQPDSNELPRTKDVVELLYKENRDLFMELLIREPGLCMMLPKKKEGEVFPPVTLRYQDAIRSLIFKSK